jgi:hypothetical protein
MSGSWPPVKRPFDSTRKAVPTSGCTPIDGLLSEREIKMKSIAIVLALAVSGIAVSAGFVPASASKMDSNTGNMVPKACSAYAQFCQGRFPASAAACVSAGARCKQTGVFTNPAGKSFSGLAKE